MKVRLRIRGEANNARFVLGSLLERLPVGASYGTRDLTDAVIEVEPLELLKALLHATLAEIDPQRLTSVDYGVEPSVPHGETPRVDDVVDSVQFVVELTGADPMRASEVFPVAAESWPGGVLLRDQATDDAGQPVLLVEVMPKWLVERAVSDSIRAYDPALALSMGRVVATSLAPTPDVKPIDGLSALDPAEQKEGPVMHDGMWGVLARHGDRWQCEHPASGTTGYGSDSHEAIAQMAEMVKERGLDAPG